MGVREFTGWGVSVAVTIAVVMLIGVFGFGWFQKETAGFRGDVRETERLVADPEYRVAIYDQFFELCTGVQSAEAGIEAQTDELARTTEPERRAQLESNLSALETQRANLINQYNNKAGAERTQGRYFPSELPSRLSINQEETSCAA
jgi:hypothetical protein